MRLGRRGRQLGAGGGGVEVLPQTTKTERMQARQHPRLAGKRVATQRTFREPVISDLQQSLTDYILCTKENDA